MEWLKAFPCCHVCLECSGGDSLEDAIAFSCRTAELQPDPVRALHLRNRGRLICAAYRGKLNRLFQDEYGWTRWRIWQIATLMSIFNDYDCCSASVTEKLPSLSQTILRISESILGLDFNQMSDDAELLRNTHMLLASCPSRACATWTFWKIIFHKVWKGWSKLQGDSLASETRVCLIYTWSVRSRQSEFFLQMLCGVTMPMVWNAVDL